MEGDSRQQGLDGYRLPQGLERHLSHVSTPRVTWRRRTHQGPEQEAWAASRVCLSQSPWRHPIGAEGFEAQPPHTCTFQPQRSARGPGLDVGGGSRTNSQSFKTQTRWNRTAPELGERAALSVGFLVSDPTVPRVQTIPHPDVRSFIITRPRSASVQRTAALRWPGQGPEDRVMRRRDRVLVTKVSTNLNSGHTMNGASLSAGATALRAAWCPASTLRCFPAPRGQLVLALQLSSF